MKRDEMRVKVYMDFINYRNEVVDSTLIAEFRTMNWARDFIKEAKRREDSGWRVRVENKEEQE